LSQGRDSGVDPPIEKSGVGEDHKLDVPGNTKIAACGRDTHEVILPLDGRARVAPLKFHANLGGAWRSAIIDARKRQHVYVIGTLSIMAIMI
jgi:hypothetical protein